MLSPVTRYVANLVIFCSVFAIKMHFDSQIDQIQPKKKQLLGDFLPLFTLETVLKTIVSYKYICWKLFFNCNSDR